MKAQHYRHSTTGTAIQAQHHRHSTTTGPKKFFMCTTDFCSVELCSDLKLPFLPPLLIVAPIKTLTIHYLLHFLSSQHVMDGVVNN